MHDAPTNNPLPPIAREVDRTLCSIDDRLDWLRALSPLDTRDLWQQFRDNGCRHMPAYRYPELDFDLKALRRELLSVPVEQVERNDLSALFWEKQRQLDQQIELVALRGSDGFLPASIDLWGDAEPDLVEAARDVLNALPDETPRGALAGHEDVLREAERQLAGYRRRQPDFQPRVVVVPDLSAKLMVSRGDLYVAEDIAVPQAQVAPLIHHEIGTHALTRYNGSLQPLKQLECGLGHYHSLQEGLGVLAEYLSGHLAPNRVRILAARVLATHRICQQHPLADIYRGLVEECGLEDGEAFNVTLRVGRGGGMTKDAAYLRGLRDLVDHLKSGAGLAELFVGKIALWHLPILASLGEAGLVEKPALLPAYLDTAAARERIDACRHQPFLDLVCGEPAP